MPSQNVLIVELNEFNIDLVNATLQQQAFPALKKIFSLKKSSYKTADRYNSGYLEPWVQWVSVHTGVPSVVHGIKHLGDVPHLHIEQCWETLSQHGISTGVWGVMNGERRHAENNRFFLPDPWTFSEWATPAKLNALLGLPRYVAKHYQHLKYTRIIKESLKLLAFIFKSGKMIKILQAVGGLLAALKQFGYQHFVFISFFDYLSTLLFIEYKKKYQPQCCYLFFNSLAHLQHHHWREGVEKATPEILLGFHYLEKIFQLLLEAFPQDAIVVHNGLSQMNTNHETPWVLYRQKDPRHFFKALALPIKQLEQHMTHDGHVFFQTAEACHQAFEALRDARLDNKPLFHVEKNQNDPCKLFYMLQFTEALDPSSSIEFIFNGKKYRFFDYFDRIVTRTGRHLPLGNIFSNLISFPNHIQNHDFNRYIYAYLLPDKFPLTSKKLFTLEEEE